MSVAWFEQVEAGFVLGSLREEAAHPDEGRRSRALAAQRDLLSARGDPARETEVLVAFLLALLPELASLLRLTLIRQSLLVALEQGADLAPHLERLASWATAADLERGSVRHLRDVGQSFLLRWIRRGRRLAPGLLDRLEAAGVLDLARAARAWSGPDAPTLARLAAADRDDPPAALWILEETLGSSDPVEREAGERAARGALTDAAAQDLLLLLLRTRPAERSDTLDHLAGLIHCGADPTPGALAAAADLLDEPACAYSASMLLRRAAARGLPLGPHQARLDAWRAREVGPQERPPEG